MTAASPATEASNVPAKPRFFADLYSFDWHEFSFKLPAVSAGAVAICLFTGIMAGHPGGGLIAGGGAFTIGFGANQRIADSRVVPMIAAVIACSAATLVGTLAGHKTLWPVLAAGVSAFIYGLLTTRNKGLSWVGQQASVALVVASAFPTSLKPALVRAGLIAAGGVVQLVITTAGLRLLPNLHRELISFATSFYGEALNQEQEIVRKLREFPRRLPALPADAALGYSVRLVVTMCLATEVYRRIGIQSGYWIPMTALLVQKPAFAETLTRATARILGTGCGAWLCSLLVAHVPMHPVVLAGMTTLFALLAFATNSVNYGLFTACLTAYIVFLLSLNQIPAPDIAHRRALCTILGGLIALAIHLDALRRHHDVRLPKTVSPSG